MSVNAEICCGGLIYARGAAVVDDLRASGTRGLEPLDAFSTSPSSNPRRPPSTFTRRMVGVHTSFHRAGPPALLHNQPGHTADTQLWAPGASPARPTAHWLFRGDCGKRSEVRPRGGGDRCPATQQFDRLTKLGHDPFWIVSLLHHRVLPPFGVVGLSFYLAQVPEGMQREKALGFSVNIQYAERDRHLRCWRPYPPNVRWRTPADCPLSRPHQRLFGPRRTEVPSCPR
jgi:hypothetical protein